MAIKERMDETWLRKIRKTAAETIPPTPPLRVGSARIDERGKAYGGKAGDQTGRELSTQRWYLHKKGWRVFRAKDRAAALKIAADMEAACKNSHIGYDQWQRNTLYKAAEPLGFDCAKVKTNCETDCSELVRVCWDCPAIFERGTCRKICWRRARLWS